MQDQPYARSLEGTVKKFPNLLEGIEPSVFASSRAPARAWTRALKTAWDRGFDDIYAAGESYALMLGHLLENLKEKDVLEMAEVISPEDAWHILNTLADVPALKDFVEREGFAKALNDVAKALLSTLSEEELFSEEPKTFEAVLLFEKMVAKTLPNPHIPQLSQELLYKMRDAAYSLADASLSAPHYWDFQSKLSTLISSTFSIALEEGLLDLLSQLCEKPTETVNSLVNPPDD